MQRLVHFVAGTIAFFHWKRHLFRIYVLPAELLVLRIGTNFHQLGTAGGTIGGAYGGYFARRYGLEVEAKTQQLDAGSLDDLREWADHDKDSFSATSDELRRLRLDPPPRFLGIQWWGYHQMGMLSFLHLDRGRYRLELFSLADMKTAYEELPKAFGDRVTIGVEWNERKQQYIWKK